MLNPFSRKESSFFLQCKVAFRQADVSSLPRMRSLLLSLIILYTALQAATIFQRSYETRTDFVYSHYSVPPTNEAIDTGVWWIPWPNNFLGRLGWYRQGLREVQKHRDFIQTLAGDELPPILLAAAIANQGNSPQRPFGWEGLERIQAWLGYRFEWRLPPQPLTIDQLSSASLATWFFAARQWAYAHWVNYFEEPSVGVGQIQPDEARRLAYAGDRIDLFSDRASIGLMQAKMVNAYHLFTSLDLSQTELFALLAISNNDNSDGVGILQQFQKAQYHLPQLLRESFAARRQLARMMTYVEYLNRQDCWEVPKGVNIRYLWWLVHNTESLDGIESRF